MNKVKPQSVAKNKDQPMIGDNVIYQHDEVLNSGLQLNWKLRRAMAISVMTISALATAFSFTLALEKHHYDLRVEHREAAQVQLLADYTTYLAKETAAVGALNNSEQRQYSKLSQINPQIAYLKAAFSNADLLDEIADYDFLDLHTARTSAVQRKCLAQAIYFEARSEKRIGQVAVADVVMNRVASRFYPDTICEVVFQGSERITGCQFSFTCDGSMDGARLTQNNRKWAEAENMAGSFLAGMRVPVSRQATHYHANYVDPDWAEELSPTATIGTHKFYRFNTRKVGYAAPAGL